MNHLSRGGFITRSTKVGKPHYKKRTAALHKKRGDRKTQKRGFFGMGLFGGSPKRKRSASASSTDSDEEPSQYKKMLRKGELKRTNYRGEDPYAVKRRTLHGRSLSNRTPVHPNANLEYYMFTNMYARKFGVDMNGQEGFFNRESEIKNAYKKYLKTGYFPGETPAPAMKPNTI